MGKGKARLYPDKKQNKYGSRCSMYCEIKKPDGSSVYICDCGGSNSTNDTKICKGNRHNCCKTRYHRNASRSEAQKINEYYEN